MLAAKLAQKRFRRVSGLKADCKISSPVRVPPGGGYDAIPLRGSAGPRRCGQVWQNRTTRRRPWTGTEEHGPVPFGLEQRRQVWPLQPQGGRLAVSGHLRARSLRP